MAKIGLIINTFEQADYLGRVLQAVTGQRRQPDEVLLADDGSGEPTRIAFEHWQGHQPFRSVQAWQPHEGFRRSRILNQAIAQSQSDYLVFLDGDTVPHPEFLADHERLQTPETLVQGHRALIRQAAAGYFGKGTFPGDRWRALWTGQLQGLRHAFRWPRPWRRVRRDLHGVRGCNLAVWRRDLVRANGYNEAFEGWGREDSELVLRLMNLGVRRLDVRGWALCYHLWHPPASRARVPANDQLLASAQASTATVCERGLNQYLTASE